jgi:hypothetical protein
VGTAVTHSLVSMALHEIGIASFASNQQNCNGIYFVIWVLLSGTIITSFYCLKLTKIGRFKNCKFCRKLFSFEYNIGLCHSSQKFYKIICTSTSMFIKCNYITDINTLTSNIFHVRALFSTLCYVTNQQIHYAYSIFYFITHCFTNM